MLQPFFVRSEKAFDVQLLIQVVDAQTSVDFDEMRSEPLDGSRLYGLILVDDVTDDFLRALELTRSDVAKSRRESSHNMPDIGRGEDAMDAGTAVGM